MTMWRMRGWVVWVAMGAALAGCSGDSRIAADPPQAVQAAAAGPAAGGADALATIRKNLAARFPQFANIDEVAATPMPGLYEVRVNGTDIFYSDAQGNYVLQGQLIDAQQRRNLTEERVNKLSAIALDALPVKDAFTIVRGDGKRQLAVFEDPNCGYCKRFERDLQQVDNVTIRMFLYPILGQDSTDKSKAIWCAKDPAKAWTDWMLRNVPPPAAGADCDAAALERNVALGRKHRITGTPTLVFADGTRVPGAIDAVQVEQHLADARK